MLNPHIFVQCGVGKPCQISSTCESGSFLLGTMTAQSKPVMVDNFEWTMLPKQVLVMFILFVFNL
jgi:hypothetical protein